MEIDFKDLRVGDKFAEDMSTVLFIGPWQQIPCYRLINENEEDLIVSKNHLIQFETDEVLNENCESRKQVHEYGVVWASVEDLYNKFGANDIITPTGMKFNIEPYENGEPQMVRCIMTDVGTYTINGFVSHNSSRGTHALDSMKEIVADLIASGMSEEWIATNLFLDKEAIGRYKQLSGLATAFRSEGDFSENVWDPRKDNLQERKDATKLNQLARAYVRKWKELANVGGNNHDIPPTVDLLTAAKNLGFDVNNPYIIPVKVDPETGEVEETALVENKEA